MTTESAAERAYQEAQAKFNNSYKRAQRHLARNHDLMDVIATHLRPHVKYAHKPQTSELVSCASELLLDKHMPDSEVTEMLNLVSSNVWKQPLTNEDLQTLRTNIEGDPQFKQCTRYLDRLQPILNERRQRALTARIERDLHNYDIHNYTAEAPIHRDIPHGAPAEPLSFSFKPSTPASAPALDLNLAEPAKPAPAASILTADHGPSPAAPKPQQPAPPQKTPKLLKDNLPKHPRSFMPTIPSVAAKSPNRMQRMTAAVKKLFLGERVGATGNSSIHFVLSEAPAVAPTLAEPIRVEPTLAAEAPKPAPVQTPTAHTPNAKAPEPEPAAPRPSHNTKPPVETPAKSRFQRIKNIFQRTPKEEAPAATGSGLWQKVTRAATRTKEALINNPIDALRERFGKNTTVSHTLQETANAAEHSGGAVALGVAVAALGGWAAYELMRKDDKENQPPQR